MILARAEWSAYPWLEHGFGTRHSERWTHGPERAWVNQVHGNTVCRVTAPGPQGTADALATDQPGLMLEIRTADCLPILLADPRHRAIAAVHAGWRGSVAGIALRTVERMREWFGSEPSEIQAVIGPGIGVCCFEVGPEVAVAFGQEGRVRIDLVAFNRRQLERAGLCEIAELAPCTKCGEDRFHSYRRDRDGAGRMEAGIRIGDSGR